MSVGGVVYVVDATGAAGAGGGGRIRHLLFVEIVGVGSRPQNFTKPCWRILAPKPYRHAAEMVRASRWAHSTNTPREGEPFSANDRA